MRNVQPKAWDLLAETEAAKDHRALIAALREVGECIGALRKMIAKAADSPFYSFTTEESQNELGSRGEHTEITLTTGYIGTTTIAECQRQRDSTLTAAKEGQRRG